MRQPAVAQATSPNVFLRYSRSDKANTNQVLRNKKRGSGGARPVCARPHPGELKRA